MNVARLAPLLFAFAGCGYSVWFAEAQPRPNIDLPRSRATLRLRLPKTIANDFTVGTEGMREVEVRDWRETLENGFDNGFGKLFQLVDSDRKDAELTLEIAEAELVFAPAAVAVAVSPTSFLGPSVSVVGARPQVRFKARLVDRGGHVVKRLASTATAARIAANSSPDALAEVVGEAVAALYEQVADRFFTVAAPAPARPPAE